eukprot:7153018-Pyramimonas_sp.AAC.1
MVQRAIDVKCDEGDIDSVLEMVDQSKSIDGISIALVSAGDARDRIVKNAVAMLVGKTFKVNVDKKDPEAVSEAKSNVISQLKKLMDARRTVLFPAIDSLNLIEAMIEPRASRGTVLQEAIEAWNAKDGDPVVSAASNTKLGLLFLKDAGTALSGLRKEEEEEEEEAHGRGRGKRSE